MTSDNYIATFVQQIPEKFETIKMNKGMLSILGAPEGSCLSIKNRNSIIFLKCEIDNSVMEQHIGLSYENAGKLGRIQRTVEVRIADIKECTGMSTEQKARKGEKTPTIEKGFEWDNIADTSFKDIKGLEEIEKKLKNIVYNIGHPERYLLYENKPPRAFLFFGPPGCGKTMLAKAIANDLASDKVNVKFKAIKSSDVKNSHLGESAKTIDEYFKFARSEAEKGSLVILFFDEIDSMVPTRRDEDLHEEYRDVVNIFLQELEGVKDLDSNVKLKKLYSDTDVKKIRERIFNSVKEKGGKLEDYTLIKSEIAKLRSKIDEIGGVFSVIIIGATNSPYNLDDAIISRLKGNSIFIPRPSFDAIKEMLSEHLLKPYFEITPKDVDDLAEEAYKRHITGRDIDGWMTRVRESIPNEGLTILGYDTIKNAMPPTSVEISWEINLYKYLLEKGYDGMARQVEDYLKKLESTKRT